jgi:Fur family peroxide stress response transcriptional regulator
MNANIPYAQILQSGGFRLTPQRLAICRFLEVTEGHPTAQMIYTLLKPDFPSLSLTTVYNTLEILAGAGAIHALGSRGDEPVHFELSNQPHINLKCVHCGKIMDFFSPLVSALEEDVHQKTGFALFEAGILHYGICPDCRNQSIIE